MLNIPSETQLLSHRVAGAIDRAVALLSAGQPVGLPTETVYGLAADALNPAAAAAIFDAKARPLFDPLIVHVPDREWAAKLAELPPRAEALLARFWPGPLTVLVPRREGAVPDLVTAGSSFVALRMSAHPVFAEVIARFGGPLAAPSANRFGRISPTRAQDVMEELGGRIPFILDGGPTDHGLESTIVEFAADGALIVRRHGPVTAEMLAEHGEVRAAPSGASQTLAPGELPGHYAPRTLLRFLGGEASCRDSGLLAFRRDQPPEGFRQAARVEWLTDAGDLTQAAARLFGALRALDAAGLPVIVAERAPDRGIGVAINERLSRAAAVRPREGRSPFNRQMNPTQVEVLIVEDNPDDLALTMMALRKGKLANEIVVAHDGVEALDFLFGRGEHAGRDTSRQPKIVLLDLKLPRIDGHEVLRAIRENPMTSELPVIVMTSSAQDRDVVESYELKVNSYVVKPVSFDRFHAAVTQVGMYWLLLNQPPV